MIHIPRSYCWTQQVFQKLLFFSEDNIRELRWPSYFTKHSSSKSYAHMAFKAKEEFETLSGPPKLQQAKTFR